MNGFDFVEFKVSKYFSGSISHGFRDIIYLLTFGPFSKISANDQKFLPMVYRNYINCLKCSVKNVIGKWLGDRFGNYSAPVH